MNLQEIKSWIKNHRHVDTDSFEIDESTNEWSSEIYTDKNGRFFKIEFLNGKPMKYKENYEVREVFKKQKMVNYYDEEKVG